MMQSDFLQALGWAVLNSLWQIALLWVLYQLVTGVLSKVIFLNKPVGPATKSSLASILLIAGFGWFIYTFLSIFTNHSTDDVVISSGIINAEGNQQLNNWLHKTLPAASFLYLILLILPLLHFTRNYRYVQIIRNNGLTKANVKWRIFVKRVVEQMGIKKPVHIWISEFVSSPVTIGYLKPVILVPLAAINNLSQQQMEAVLLHELSHIKRYDYLINLIINFIKTILYFNPFVKAFVKTVEREREKSCDEMVMQFQYDSHDYATALLILEKTHYSSKPLAVAASGKKNDLLHRIELILGIQNKTVLSFNRFAGLLAAALCVIGINALLIISKPSNNKSKDVTFNSISSPLYFFNNDYNDKVTKPEVVNDNKLSEERLASPIINHSTKNEVVSKVNDKPGAPAAALVNISSPEPAPFPDIINVSFKPVVPVPQLKNYQEEQVKEAMDASKKVIENIHWKVIEKNIADVLTQNEKELLKLNYQKEANKIDWNKLEDKLRIAYDKIDWNQINDQLNNAVYEIRLDSLQKVFSETASNLDLIERELTTNDQNGIPDTDITLKEVNQKKVEISKTLSTLKALRNKKIIH
ncbi:MAG: M56 family metallopeptidase, partial [Bacteroidia bacterium]|nr:M56 family metallopeptidase [Bacteroidia bacterium]